MDCPLQRREAGRLAEALHAYLHPHVLVIDEIGYLTLQDKAAVAKATPPAHPTLYVVRCTLHAVVS